jgi:hypothetical protein
MNKNFALTLTVCASATAIMLMVLVLALPSWTSQELAFPKQDYVNMIEQLKNDSFQFYTADQPYVSGKVVYLVHCADYSFKGADTFLSVESQEDVKSTFMIRPDSTFFPQTIQTFLSIQNQGWKLGYEYDCLSRADGNMTLAVLMFQAQVNYLKDLGFKLCVTDAHGDMEYNGTVDSNQIYIQHPELWTQNNLTSVFDLPNFQGYQYFSDSNFHKIVLPTNLGDKLIIELHCDWWGLIDS